MARHNLLFELFGLFADRHPLAAIPCLQACTISAIHMHAPRDKLVRVGSILTSPLVSKLLTSEMYCDILVLSY